MKYFYAVHAQASEETEVYFFITASDETVESQNSIEIPPLTIEMVKSNKAFIDFSKRKSMKRILIDYAVYRTETDYTGIEDDSLEDYLMNLIKAGKAERLSTSELDISSGVKASTGKKKKKKVSSVFYAVVSCLVVVALMGGVLLGKYLNDSALVGEIQETEVETAEEENQDGLIVPNEVYINPEAQQITVSIDRSYYAVPKEDIQLKGEVDKGAATITLPYFDPTDYFTHVSGYTWGFTSDPNGEKIEYHGGSTYSFTKDTKLYRVLVKYGGGNGTKDDPYIINYYDQLELMAQEKARGYFKQTADITFPSGFYHNSINTVNELKAAPDKEYFEYDGGGFKIVGLTSPLFETVSGSVIKNVNITNSTINSSVYKDYGFIVCKAYNYRYEVDGITYETGETIIKNSTVSNSAIYMQYPETDEKATTTTPVHIIVAPENDEGTAPQEQIITTPTKYADYTIGGITGLGGQIENCYVTNLLIMANLENYYLYVGGVSGKPANVINTGVNNLLVNGKIFNAGGIVGSVGGSRMHTADGSSLPVYYGGNIMGCYVRSFTGYVENSAGGIAGESSTNAENALISNSYTTNIYLSVGIFEDEQRTKPLILGKSGGIIGTDGKENNGHLVTNCISPLDYSVIGFISNSNYDATVRTAPTYAFYQTAILDILNKNTVKPNNLTNNDTSKEIFTGSFVYAEDERNSDENGKLPYPAEIAVLFEKTYVEGSQ